MKILLINPPRSTRNLIRDYAPEEMKPMLEKMGIVAPPLSLCSLAGNLKDFEVDVFDLKAEFDLHLISNNEEAIARKLQEFKPDIVGVSVLTSEYNGTCKLLLQVKQYDPGILTVVGGIHPVLAPGDFNLPCVDLLLFGHGKKIFREIVLERERKGDFSSISNIAVVRDGKLHYTPFRNLYDTPEDLLSHVYADRSLVAKYDQAYATGPMRLPMSLIETSYGCDFRCNFCSIWPMHKGNYAVRDIDHIVSEIRETMTGYPLIRFADANSMGDIAYTHRLFERVIKEDLKKAFIADIRNDTAALHPDLISKASEAGLKVSITGIESIKNDELDSYNKQSSRDIILRSLEVFQNNNIQVRGLFIIRPDYTEKDFDDLEKFSRENNLGISALTVLTPFPGTALYNEVKDKIVIKDYDYYNLHNSVVKTALPEEEFYRRISALGLCMRSASAPYKNG